MNIYVSSNEKVVNFAAEELQNYLARMGQPQLNYNLSVADLTEYGMAQVANNQLDDQYYISVTKEEQIILGNNPRALLLGVYRYLTLIGCRFLRPGKDFEIVPSLSNKSCFYANEKHTASLRHRGVCIEGCDSVENIADFLDWLPKVGYNSFFFQFKTPHTFLKRWYKGYNDTHEAKGEWTESDSKQIMEHFNAIMDKRGLLRHRVGHGWTAEVIGTSDTAGWEKSESLLSDELRPLVAEVRGVRELHKGIAVNTNLCLTNPKTLEKFGELVLKYLENQPDTEYLHIWLADGMNNSCECENCASLRPADHYISLLNYIDEQLLKADLNTRICILMYEDLLWPPIKNKLNNLDRFVFMFAPIHRSFEVSYMDIKELPPVPEFKLNRLVFPKDVATNISLLKEWRNTITCDAFVYDYPLGRAHHGDPTHISISRLIHRDLLANNALGLNGIISCQELRVSFPNSLANYVMGRTALNLNATFEEIANEYYLACYGKSGIKLFEIMDKLSVLFSMDYTNPFCYVPRINSDLADKMSKVPTLLKSLEDLIKNHEKTENEAQNKIWDTLPFFVEYTSLFAEIIRLCAKGENEQALELFEQKYKPLVYDYESVDQGLFDTARYIHTLKGAILKK